jgi:DNA-binding NtrC family response regulator
VAAPGGGELTVLAGMEESTRSVWDSLRAGGCGSCVDQGGEGQPLRERLLRFEREQIAQCLEHETSLRGAARTLGLPHSTLLRKLRQHGLAVQE